MVRDGLGDESGAKAIEQRGIDFAPTEDFLQGLKTAGANEAFLAALRAAKPPQQGNEAVAKPLDQVQVFVLLAGQVTSHRVTTLVQERGIDFDPTEDYLQELRLGGADDQLISVVRTAKVTKLERVDREVQAREAEVRYHVARAIEYLRKRRHADAQSEYRAAIRLDPENADLHLGLATALDLFDEGGRIAEYREAVRLDRRNPEAHLELGLALGAKFGWDGEIAELREALRLKPDAAAEAPLFLFALDVHDGLGLALAAKGDWDGVITEERELVRLRPDYSPALVRLGVGLRHKGGLDGDIAEQHEALRLDPSNEEAHIELGMALAKAGSAEFRFPETPRLFGLHSQSPARKRCRRQVRKKKRPNKTKRRKRDTTLIMTAITETKKAAPFRRSPNHTLVSCFRVNNLSG